MKNIALISNNWASLQLVFVFSNLVHCFLNQDLHCRFDSTPLFPPFVLIHFPKMIIKKLTINKIEERCTRYSVHPTASNRAHLTHDVRLINETTP